MLHFHFHTHNKNKNINTNTNANRGDGSSSHQEKEEGGCVGRPSVGCRKFTRGESFQKKGHERRQGRSVPAAIKLEYLPSIVVSIWSRDSDRQLEATTQLGELLSIETNPPIKEVTQSGVVPRLVDFLLRHDFPELQLEAAGVLTDIVSGTSEYVDLVVDHGAVPRFIELLHFPSNDVRQQAVWALGNIAGDSPCFRDFVLGHGALSRLLAQLNEHCEPSMLKIATWTLSNFCQGEPQPSFDQVKPALPALAWLIDLDDEDVLPDVCWALSGLSDGTTDKIQAVIEADVCPRLVYLLQHPSPSVLIPALRTVGNIVSGDDIQTQYIIGLQALPLIHNLLTNNYKTSIKKDACWTISNITAGSKTQIQAVIDANIIDPLVRLLQNAKFVVKKEAARAISFAASNGTHRQIGYLVSKCCIKPLCDLLTCSDTGTVETCLEGLENILKVGEANKNLVKNKGVNRYATLIDEAEGLEKIQNLKNHENMEIYEKTVKILKAYWDEEEEDEEDDDDEY